MTDPLHIWARLKPHRARLMGAGVLVTVAAWVPGAAVLVLDGALERLEDTSRPMHAPALALVALGVLQGGVSYIRTRWTKEVAWDVARGLRQEVHSALMARSPWDASPQGRRLEVILTEVDNIQYGVSGLIGMVRNPLTLVGLAAAMAAVAPTIALWGAALLPVGVGASGWGGRLLARRAKAYQDARNDLAALANDQLGAAPAIRAQAAEVQERARFAKAAGSEASTRVALDTGRVVPRAVTHVGAMGVIGALLVVAHGQVVGGHLDGAAWVAFMVGLGLAIKPLGDLSEAWSLLKRSRAAMGTVAAILSERGTSSDGVWEGPLSGVRLQGVSLRFGEGPLLFKGVDLDVKPGRLTLITGPSGSGKTSLLKLMTGDVETFHGAVLVEGRPVSDWQRARLRAQMAVVHQDPFLLCRSVRENLALGHASNDEAIWVALRKADCGFVERLPGGLDYRLGQDGFPLSGGERQRLCLARALLREAPLLLLDEPTSQVGAQTTRAFVKVLHTLKGRCAIVLATHDPELLGLADERLDLGTLP